MSQTVFTSCLSGFTLNNKLYCIRCDPLCAVCSAINPLVCYTAIDGYYLDGGVPKKCDLSCLKCNASGTGKCTECKVGNYLEPLIVGTCKPCMPECFGCSNATDCEKCRLGFVYHPSLKQCVKCLSGCTFCQYDKIYECAECSKGYEAVKNEGITECKKCPEKCLTCSGGVCSECREGLRLVNNKCIPQCENLCK